MKLDYSKIIFFVASLFLMTFICIPNSSAKDSTVISKEKIVLGGGPSGGIFQTVANAIASLKPIKEAAGFRIQLQSSEGSVENIKKIDSGSLQMAIVYSGDLWRGINGKIENYTQDSSSISSSSATNLSSSSFSSSSNLANSPTTYKKVMAVASLYTASAQLVVHAGLETKGDNTTINANSTKNEAIKSVKELEGKRIGVGNSGSGSYSTCELFLTHLGLWDKIEKRAIGYNDAARAFKNNEIDAFWVFSALPCPAVAMAAGDKNKGFENNGSEINSNNSKGLIEIINLGDDAYESGFLKEFPWFATTTIKSGTYNGVDKDILSFQDYAILVVNSELSSDVVYQMLSIIYTDDALNHLSQQNTNLKEMSVETGVIGIITPLHSGAERFWKEKGIIK
ncbi:MAG: ABC transporter substrate-binding protein [Desulfamplus sp.]|nr:ABC transporter substrate-binding protein [Desulfamplus sp.]